MVVLVLAVTPFTGQAVAEVSNSTHHNLTITVMNQYNQTPISNANVTITGPEILSGTTDSNGIVVFRGILSGNYSVVTTAPGFPMSSTQPIPPLTSDLAMTLWYTFTKAFFTYSPTRVVPKTTVFFNASASGSSGTIGKFSWDFGDNQTGSGVTTSHLFTKAGTYHVSLLVTSSVGAAQYTQLIIVASPGGNDIYFIIPIIAALLLPLFLLFFWRRRRYYVAIQARVPLDRRQIHCPGDNTNCEECKLTPC